MNFLVVGVNIRDIASSIQRMGHNAYTVNYFNSVDINSISETCRCYLPKDLIEINDLSSKIWENFYLKSARELLEHYPIDCIIPKINNEKIDILKEHAPIIGNSLKKLEDARGKWLFYKLARKLDVKNPKTWLVEDGMPKNVSFPLILKPTMGSSGSHVYKIKDSKHLNTMLKKLEGVERRFIIQEYIEGESYNINLVSNGMGIKPLFISRQVFDDAKGFSYLGNIGPYDIDDFEDVVHSFVRLYKKLKLRGCLGGDFILTPEGEHYIIELNPRLQGSFEVVEESLHVNMFRLHFDAWKGEMSEIPDPKTFAGKKTIFAKKECKVGKLSTYDFVRDIPHEGVIVTDGSPICTVTATADSKMEVLKEIKRMEIEVKAEISTSTPHCNMGKTPDSF